jgi:hypothetical protein
MGASNCYAFKKYKPLTRETILMLKNKLISMKKIFSSFIVEFRLYMIYFCNTFCIQWLLVSILRGQVHIRHANFARPGCCQCCEYFIAKLPADETGEALFSGRHDGRAPQKYFMNGVLHPMKCLLSGMPFVFESGIRSFAENTQCNRLYMNLGNS